MAEETKGIIVWSVAIAAGLMGLYFDKQQSGEWDLATFIATGFVGLFVGWAIASIAAKVLENPQKARRSHEAPSRSLSEKQRNRGPRQLKGEAVKRDDDIETEMIASQLALMKQFGMDSMARGSVGNATVTARIAVDKGLTREDALQFGRAVMLNTIKVERPGLVPQEGIDSIGNTIQDLEERYGEAVVGTILDEAEEWARHNE